MSALAQCDAFGFIYDQAGDPAADILVVLKRVLDASGNPILLSPKTTVTDSAGSFHFTLPEAATAFISARASALWNCPDGRAFTVPPGPSGELIPSFSLPASSFVEPPLVYVGDVLSIPKASASQDGYLSAADFVAFEAGAEMGVNQINLGTGLTSDTGGPITDTGTILLEDIPGIAGTYPNPTSITVNAQGQIIAITAGAPDTTAPIISAVGTSSLTATSVTITWTTNEPADSQVEYGPTTAYGTSTPLNTSPVTSHSVPITGLTANTLYHYRVKSRDTASNLATSADFTFTTPLVTDTTPPVLSGIHVASLAPTSAAVAWTTDEASDSQVEYGPTTSYGSSTTIDPSLVTSHSVPISGLTPTTLYHFRVKSKDASLNLATSGDFTLTTPAVPDTTAPGISAVNATGVTSNTASITWTTDEASDSQVEYGLTTAYGSSTTLDATLVTSHSVPLAGLASNTLYHYRVKSQDASLNLGTSADASFTTLAGSVDLLTALVSYWKMDTITGGITPDELGNNNLTAIMSGGGTVTAVTSEIGLGNEILGAGSTGTGSETTLQAPDNPTQHFTGSFSVAGWLSIHVNDGTQLHTVLSKGGNTEPNLAWDLWYNEYISAWEFVVYADGTNATRAPASIAMAPVISTPYFMVGIYDAAAGEVRLSMNGATPVVAAFTGTVFSSSLPMASIYPGSNFANCAVDEVGLWNRVLTPDEIIALYNGGAGLTYPFS